jgi:hypothetical protein
MLSKPIEEAVVGLIEMGVLNEQGLIRLGHLFGALKTLREATVGAADLEPREERLERTEPEGESGPAETPVEAAPDPEFTDDVHGLITPEAASKLKAIAGFVKGYSEEHLAKEPSLPRKRKVNGSFHITPQDLMALRKTKTIKQIAIEYGVSVSTVMNRLREYGLTGG